MKTSLRCARKPLEERRVIIKSGEVHLALDVTLTETVNMNIQASEGGIFIVQTNHCLSKL